MKGEIAALRVADRRKSVNADESLHTKRSCVMGRSTLVAELEC